MYQIIILAGALGGDPEMRYTPTGTAVCDLSVATSKTWTDKDGKSHEKTIWWKATCWGNQAQAVSKYLLKGAKVLISGEIEEPDAWIDKQTKEAKGRNHITVREIKFLTGQGGAKEVKKDGGLEEISESDLPF